MKLDFYQIDAFTDTLFGGNPAVVVPLKEWLPDALLLKITQENAVAETAFFVDKGEKIHLRWFTPEIEMDLCGHATLATVHALKTILHDPRTTFVFETLSGDLTVLVEDDYYFLNFPSRMPVASQLPENLKLSFNIKPKEVLKSRDYVLVFENEEDIKNLEIDRNLFNQINMETGGVIVTAPGKNSDFVSRFFTPQASILELAFIIKKKKMKFFINSILFVVFLIFFSCGEPQCDCVTPKKIENFYKVSLTPKTNFKIYTDTIWIDGIVSSKVFDESIKDSIFSEIPIRDVISIYIFVSPTKDYNCVDAIDKFELIDDNNGILFFESCKSGTIIKNSKLSSNNSFFKYRFGLIPKHLGSYAISFQSSKIKNINRNTSIVENYPIVDFPNQIGFNSCGNLSWRKLNESEREYYFNVTN